VLPFQPLVQKVLIILKKYPMIRKNKVGSTAMIHEQASRLTSWLVSKKIIEEKVLEVYAYGFELIVSGLINILLMAITSVLFGRYYDWLLFLAAFIPLRMTAGGYHASSHFKCISVGTVGFSVLLAVSSLPTDWTIFILVIATLSFLLILLFSPVEARNKKLKEEHCKNNRVASIYVGVVNILIAVAVFFIQRLSDVLSIYFAGVFAAALSMLAVKTKPLERRCRK